MSHSSKSTSAVKVPIDGGSDVVVRIVRTSGCEWRRLVLITSCMTGIDGFIASSVSNSPEELESWIPIQVVSRENFSNETEEGFDLLCDRPVFGSLARHLDRMVIVAFNVRTRALYFSVITNEMKSTGEPMPPTVHFDKLACRFDVGTLSDLVANFATSDAGRHLMILQIRTALICRLPDSASPWLRRRYE